MAVDLDLDQAIDCRLCRPRLIGKVETGVILVAAGFRITLANAVGLVWARLRLQSIREESRFQSVFPRSVVESVAHAGRFAVDEQGSIGREIVDPRTAAPSAPRFAPYLVAETLGESVAFWDFVPFNRSAPVGSDQLAFTVAEDRDGSAQFEARMMLAVDVGKGDPVSLELHPERLKVDRAGG